MGKKDRNDTRTVIISVRVTPAENGRIAAVARGPPGQKHMSRAEVLRQAFEISSNLLEQPAVNIPMPGITKPVTMVVQFIPVDAENGNR